MVEGRAEHARLLRRSSPGLLSPFSPPVQAMPLRKPRPWLAGAGRMAGAVGDTEVPFWVVMMQWV